MSRAISVDPATYRRIVKECLEAHVRGNAVHANTLAMCAGVDAGNLGHTLDDCPFIKPGHLDLQLQWNWGRAQAIKANDNVKQRSLL